MVNIEYTISTAFSNGVSVKLLKLELGMINQVPTYVSVNDDTLLLNYPSARTAQEQTDIDTVVANHSGVAPAQTQIMETIMLVPTDTKIHNSNDWQDFGGVIVSPDAFPAKISNIRSQITGQYKIDSGMDAEISLLESGFWNGLTDTELLEPPTILPHTNGLWLPFTAITNVNIRPGYWSYVFRARKGTCTEFFLRYLTLSIIEVEA